MLLLKVLVFLLKPPLSEFFLISLAFLSDIGGAKEDRIPDLLRAKQALSQLSYGPMVGLNGLEPSTSPLSGVRSNQLSYRPSDSFFIR